MTNTDTTAAQLVFVAWGDKYIEEALIALKSFRAFHDIQATLITDVAHTGLPFENLEVIKFKTLGNHRKIEGQLHFSKKYNTSFWFCDTDLHVTASLTYAFSFAKRYAFTACYAPHYDLFYFQSGMKTIFEQEKIDNSGIGTINSGFVHFDKEFARAVLETAYGYCEKYQSICQSDQALLSLALHKTGIPFGTLPPSFNCRSNGAIISGTTRIWHSHAEPPNNLNANMELYPRIAKDSGVLDIMRKNQSLRKKLDFAVSLRNKLSGRVALKYLWFKKVRRKSMNKRIFVYGCGHSGTTLTHRIIGYHPDVHPVNHESNVFVRGNGDMTVFDWSCIANGKENWVEKTPRHVHHLHKIFLRYPNSKGIFVTRNPLDTVASLKERFSFEDGLERYISDSRAGLEYLEHPNVFHLKLEDWIENESNTARALLQFLGLKKFDVLQYHRTYKTFFSSEKHKHKSHEANRDFQINQPIHDTRGRYKSILTTDEIKVVLERTSELSKTFGY